MMKIKNSVLKGIIDKGGVKSIKDEKQVGTNCEGFLVNFLKKGKRVRYFMKKTFVLGEKKENLEKDYILLKKYFKNLIPNTVFIEGKDKNIFSFSDPIIIDFDLLDKKNISLIKKILENKENSNIRKKIQFFIRKFELLREEEGKILDLYGEENLIFTKEGDIKYIDNFKIFHDNMIVNKKSLENIEYLKELLI